MPLPFWSNPLFLSKTIVHVSPFSKYDEPELKSELTWWVSRWAWARVIGPRGVVEVDTGVGVDVSLVAISSSIHLSDCVFALCTQEDSVEQRYSVHISVLAEAAWVNGHEVELQLRLSSAYWWTDRKDQPSVVRYA
jgi:hypothetical protein